MVALLVATSMRRCEAGVGASAPPSSSSFFNNKAHPTFSSLSSHRRLSSVDSVDFLPSIFGRGNSHQSQSFPMFYFNWEDTPQLPCVIPICWLTSIDKYIMNGQWNKTASSIELYWFQSSIFDHPIFLGFSARLSLLSIPITFNILDLWFQQIR